MQKTQLTQPVKINNTHSFSTHTTWHLTHPKPLTPKAIIGRCAENLVCYHLLQTGWQIRERNYASHEGEIDIIAEKMHEDLKGYPTIAFIEVKSRSTDKGLSPALSVSTSKQKKLARMRKLWIGKHPREKAVYRFDIATVILKKFRPPKLTWYRNAFVPHEEFGW